MRAFEKSGDFQEALDRPCPSRVEKPRASMKKEKSIETDAIREPLSDVGDMRLVLILVVIDATLDEC